ETAEGNLQVIGPDFTVGEEMHVSIRPEYLEVSTAPVAGFTLEGNIKDFIYQGSVVKTAVDLKGGMEVKYSRFEQDNSVSEGDKVYVCWNPEKAVAIKKFEQGAV
ncbi:MAG: TOBE domain-containing protein, partial [Anaerotignum sp.]|nr:TOBE domain-containing protein [Anaerotignum sp.]